MSLSKLVSFVDGLPSCGTRPPGPPHFPRPGLAVFAIGNSAEQVALNPQPLPPMPETATFLWQAIRLHQYGDVLKAAAVAGDATEVIFQRAGQIYDDGQCGSVPWSVVLQWLRFPPPPPPPWLEGIGQAVSNVLVGARMGGEFGKQLNAAATGVIKEQLGSASQR